MKKSQHFWRGLFFLFMIVALCGGLALPVTGNLPAYAAPQMRAASYIVISQVYGGGGNSGATFTNDFVELFNRATTAVDLTGWSVQYASATGTTWDVTALTSVSIPAGGYYLVQLDSAGTNGIALPAPDATGTTPMAASAGKVALVNTTTALNGSGCPLGASVIDFVGYGTTADCFEGSGRAPVPSSSVADLRSGNGCNDTNNNSVDFTAVAPSPRNSDSAISPCTSLIITDVTSSKLNGPYGVGENIDIEITFSTAVDVTGSGSPTLLLETGVTDRTATYVSGSGTDTLTFNYIVQTGDASADLDYASANALSLNGSSIVGPPGDADLTLPTPGSPGSLGANKNIVIDNGSNPTISSITRQTPAVDRTNADTLVFRVTFSEVVLNVDASDFAVTGGTTAAPTAVTVRSSSVYDVTVSGGDLASFNGTVGLGLNVAPPQDITDASFHPLSTTLPSTNESYTLDNNVPTVTVNQVLGQADPTTALPVNFDVIFSEDIVPTTFTLSDITQTGTAVGVTWSITDSGNHRNFTLSAISLTKNGTLIPSIAANRVTDLAGNNNSASTSTDNSVTFADITPPRIVTIDKATGQADPTTNLPVQFTVVFSEVINVGDFSPIDITQLGTATGITWSIADSGDHITFNLYATAVTGAGTITPFIAANRVRDLGGNSNLASTGASGDDTVVFNSAATPSVVISEFRTRGPSGTNDEFIELYNPTANYVDIGGWRINGSDNKGKVTTRATIPLSVILRPGQHYLIANNNTGGFSGSIAVDLKYSSGIADNGGIALVRGSTIVDAVGMDPGSAYKEGPVLAPLTTSPDPRSYERKLGGNSDSCQDTNNNASDFSLINPSDPQNSSTVPLRRCGILVAQSLGTTSTTITAHTPNPSLVKESVRVSVRVVGVSESLSPLGTKVNITGASGSSVDCTITLNASGTGSCNVSFTYAGTKTITATYLGDNTHSGSKASVSHSVVTATPTKYRTRTPTPQPPPPLVAINEFVPRPGHDWNHDGIINTGDEYIELLNHGVVDVNLQGYKLDDEANIGSDPFSLPSVVLKPGERIVFYGSQTGLLLGDGGDGVRLLKPNGQLADAYNYSVVRFPDQSYCRLPDNGGLDDWNEFCFPTPGLQNSLSESSVNPPTRDQESLCPISDTLPDDFMYAECPPFGDNIWNQHYWDRTGWYDEKNLPESSGKSPVFAP